MEVQLQWAARDGLMDDRGWINEVKVSNRKKSYFLREVVSMFQINPQYFQQILGVEKKQHIAVSLNMEWRASLVRVREEHVSLKYLNLECHRPDTVYNKYWHKWWLRCRAGALFLGYKKRGQCDSDCPVCQNELET